MQVYLIVHCGLWIMYFLSISDVEMTQKDLCNSLKFSKQIVNTSITNMANRKYLELKHSKNNNKDKIIALTNKGRLLIRNKVSNIRSKEISAVKKMGKKKMEEFVKLYSEFYDCLEETFVNEIR